MEETFFFYGTLLFPEVRSVVLGRDVATERAVLLGYERLRIAGRPYPGASERSGGSVLGEVVFGLSSEDVRLLDAFEDGFYERRRVSVLLSTGDRAEAQTYVIPTEHAKMLEALPWSPEEFRLAELTAFARSLRR